MARSLTLAGKALPVCTSRIQRCWASKSGPPGKGSLSPLTLLNCFGPIRRRAGNKHLPGALGYDADGWSNAKYQRTVLHATLPKCILWSKMTSLLGGPTILSTEADGVFSAANAMPLDAN